MPHRTRSNLTHVPQHIIQRGNNPQTVFAEKDCRFYLDCLLDASELGQIRDTVNRGWPTGSERFKHEIERALKRGTSPQAGPAHARHDPGSCRRARRTFQPTEKLPYFTLRGSQNAIIQA